VKGARVIADKEEAVVAYFNGKPNCC